MAFVSEDDSPWYLDSGCSRHMIGTQEHFKDIKYLNEGRYTFEDGSQGCIKEKGKTIESRPPLNNVYLVKRLKANLISISQLCDEYLIVQFTSKDCKVLDEKNKIVLHEVRLGNNCYI